MHHEFATASGPSDVPGIALHTVWQVNADESYDVKRSRIVSDSNQTGASGGTGGIAIYTVAGAGRVYLADGNVLEAVASTLILTNIREVARYHTRAGNWQFWWFEYSSSRPWHAHANEALQICTEASHQELIGQLYLDIRSERIERRKSATSAFSYLLHRWIAEWQGEYSIRPKEKTIHQTIEMIHRDIYRPWRVSELAHASGMSPRTFGIAFAKVTGLSPKQFLNRLRLEMASELLRLGIYNVSEVADRFGFSSPYHFSNAFFKHFGQRPSLTKP